jgi:hypothetical protein
MASSIRQLAVFFSLLMMTTCAYAEGKIPVIITEYHYGLLKGFLLENGKRLQDIDRITANQPHRVLADQVIMAKALKRGGIEPDFKYILVPNSVRERAEVKAGKGVISGQDQWEFNFDTSVFMSYPVIPHGTFTKGVFGRADNHRLMRVRSLEALRQFTAVYDRMWPEWDIIEGLRLKKLYHTSTIESMFLMIDRHRVDFTFSEIPNTDDQTRTVNGITLALVNGVKLVVPASRNFMVSSKHPMGQSVFDALQFGLRILRDEGTVNQLLEDAGVINRALDDWIPLNSS